MSCPDPDPYQTARRNKLVAELQAIDEANAARREREKYGPSEDAKCESFCGQALSEINEMLRQHSYKTLGVTPGADVLRALRKLYLAAHEEGQVLECARNSRLGGTTASGLPDRITGFERIGRRADGTTVVPGRGLVGRHPDAPHGTVDM